MKTLFKCLLATILILLVGCGKSTVVDESDKGKARKVFSSPDESMYILIVPIDGIDYIVASGGRGTSIIPKVNGPSQK